MAVDTALGSEGEGERTGKAFDLLALIRHVTGKVTMKLPHVTVQVGGVLKQKKRKEKKREERVSTGIFCFHLFAPLPSFFSFPSFALTVTSLSRRSLER